MSQRNKLLEQILHGTSDANIPFDGMCQLLRNLGFRERIRGSHHIFTIGGAVEILNVPPKGAKAKPYQVKQVRKLLLKYKLEGQADDSV